MILIDFVVLLMCRTHMSMAESWWEPVTDQTVPSDYSPTRWQTSFGECKIGRYAPINTQATVGVPGWPVQAFGHQMFLRYSEFIANFRMEIDGKETKPYILPGFRQHVLNDYLPTVVTEFDHAGVHYELTYLTVPNDPQPVDFIDIKLSNTSAAPAKGALMINLDGAPTLKATGELIEDRGKPLGVMQGLPEEIRMLERPVGLVDPRCVPTGGGPEPDPRFTWRDGYFGMPIEYMVKVEPGKSYPVCILTDGTPPWICWGEGYLEAWRSITLSVEGDEPRRVDLNYPLGEKPMIHCFTATDTDGDGYIKISSRANPESRQPAILHTVWVFEPGTEIANPQNLIPLKTVELPDHFITAMRNVPQPEYPAPRNVIYCGANSPGWLNDILPGDDPTWKALSLRYMPTLEPGASKTYSLKLPAIDRLELMPYNNSYRPYDTRQSWMRNLEPRHPENTAPYGEDLPVGTDPAEYAAFGPKPREIWDRQLQAARTMTKEKAVAATQALWDGIVEPRVRFLLPDKQLDNLYKTQIALMHLYLLKFEPHDIYAEMCGPFNYWDMCLRDGSYEIRALDMAGYHDMAQKISDALLIPRSKMPVCRWTLGQRDDPENDGLFMTRFGQWDGQGQTMGGLVDHALFSGDIKWLEKNWQALARSAAWIERAREKHRKQVQDPNHYTYGLLPSGVLESAGNGYPYYINAYAFYGLRQVARAADMLGKKDEAKALRAQAEDLRQRIHFAARTRFVRFNNYCGTLSVDPENKANLGTWPGCSLVYPLETFDPYDPIISGWYGYIEKESSENGGLFVQPYIQMDWAISYIRRGQPDKTAELFGTFVDCAAETMGWMEGMNGLHWEYTDFNPPKKGARGGGDMPHGEACSNFIIIMRNLLLHEEGDILHIAPATPRPWMAQSEPFGAQDAPTYFGKVSFAITPNRDRQSVAASIQLDPSRMPAKLQVYLRSPLGRGLKSVEVNGRPYDNFVGDMIVIPKPEAKIEIAARLR